MNILMLDGSKAYGGSKGELNQTLFALAKSEFERIGHSCKESRIDQGYDIQEEIEKILWQMFCSTKCLFGGWENHG